MERTKRKNVFRAELIIFLAVIVVSLLVLWIRWENSHATYKNYDIVVKKNVYCEKTQTGRVDLQIRRKGGKKAKLLQTQQEKTAAPHAYAKTLAAQAPEFFQNTSRRFAQEYALPRA